MLSLPNAMSALIANTWHSRLARISVHWIHCGAFSRGGQNAGTATYRDRGLVRHQESAGFCARPTKQSATATSYDSFSVKTEKIRNSEHYCWGSSPNATTPTGVPTNTLPFAIVGVMNLLPPN